MLSILELLKQISKDTLERMKTRLSWREYSQELRGLQGDFGGHPKSEHRLKFTVLWHQSWKKKQEDTMCKSV